MEEGSHPSTCKNCDSTSISCQLPHRIEGCHLRRMEEGSHRCKNCDPSSISCQHPIVACVVGTFVEYTILSADLQALLVPDPAQHPLLFYIMTLGTAQDYRHEGLATCLVQECTRQVQQERSCGTLYLHVLGTYTRVCMLFFASSMDCYPALSSVLKSMSKVW